MKRTTVMKFIYGIDDSIRNLDCVRHENVGRRWEMRSDVRTNLVYCALIFVLK